MKLSLDKNQHGQPKFKKFVRSGIGVVSGLIRKKMKKYLKMSCEPRQKSRSCRTNLVKTSDLEISVLHAIIFYKNNKISENVLSASTKKSVF